MFHSIDENLLKKAREGDRRAIEQAIGQLAPALVRLSLGLTGRQDVARDVLKFVFGKGASLHANWSDPAAPARWFYHHALLAARRADMLEVDPKADPLGRKLEKDFPYQAMLRAIRQLPRQQSEAILLKYGEGLDLRPIAIAMDCSTTAVGVHLDSAMNALNAMTGGQAASLLTTLHDQYQSLAMPADEIASISRHAIHKALSPRWIKRVFMLMILILLIVMAIWIYLQYT